MARSGTTSPDLLVPALDRSRPLRAQLEAGIRSGVQSGRLRPGVQLPSSRALASDLGLSRRLVVDAFGQLVAEGYLESRAGSGTRVRAAGAASTLPAPVAPSLDEAAGSQRRPRIDLFPGSPDLGRFPRRAWSAALRASFHELPDRRLGYGSPQGARELRSALTDRLGRSRGAAIEGPEQVIVCGGYTQGAAMMLRGLAAAGARRIAVEDPGYAFNAVLIEAAGLDVVPVRADGDGLNIDALADTSADAVIVTPAHGHPLGGVLSPARRSALVAWARERRALVIEDDYDAEFRYDAEPVGALQGLAPDVVALVGTVSKTLAPALRLGWIVAPPGQARSLVERRVRQDLGSPLLEQLALARLFTSGGFDRHIRGMRGHYRPRRDAVLAALAELLPAARVHGIAAGLHVLVELPEGTDEAAVIEAAERRGVGFYGLAHHCAGHPPFPGIVLGYAAHTPHELTGAVGLLAELVGAPGPRTPRRR